MSDKATTETKPSRQVSIDAFRAIIMVLMIFVNDLWTLVDIPAWLGHVAADVDGMGLADIVFPAFLFIVGLSVPFAIESRTKKGDGTFKVFLHIVSRTIALLVMGVFLVNAEVYSETAAFPKQVWTILLIVAFFLIWMAYKTRSSLTVNILKTTGIVLLVLLAVWYQTDNASGIKAMGIHWWGILGLIGWAYFISSSIYLFSGGKPLWQVLSFVFFVFFSSASFLGWLSPMECVKDYIWISGDGAMPALSMAGIVTSLAYRYFTPQRKVFWLILMAFAAILITFGLLTRPIWGISKIMATPSWTTICSGISIVGFLLVVCVTDILKKSNWYQIIKPAGTSTLTCYLIPYLHYALIGIIGVQLPLILRTGVVGLGKSFVYALLIVAVTGCLEKKNIRLKI